ncbi:AAA family ATPase [Candidatus Parabeggiatoa sp. HSG14]|uniref:AAA family ATPase n=1 Tax=Candidatus Parabeggiatoa sp. HSG14 TaxID=3055593 RepID=UPI0025A7F97D|nr:AAA family ATPase [Thiotrichales bacterium HSG14]
MKIEKLHLENIGVFNNLDLEFQSCGQPGKKAEIHIFTGANGSGKSTLLYALAGALAGPFQQPMHTELIFQRFHHSNPNAFVEVLFENKQVINYSITKRQKKSYFTDFPLIKGEIPRYLGISHAYASSNQKSVDDFINNFIQGQKFSPDANKQKGKSFAAFAYSGNRTLNSLDELTIEEKDWNPYDNGLSFLETANSEQIIQSIAVQKMKQAIEFSQNNQETAQQYNFVVQIIEKAIKDVVGWDIKFKLEAKPFSLFLEINQRVLEFNVLPDGLKSIISLIADLIRRLDKIVWIDDYNVLEHSFILLLDEIDIHLHPAWQRKVLPVIQKIFPNAQIFVSTHSPFVVGSVSDAYVYSFKLTENVSILDKVKPSQAGNSYSLILETIFGVEESFDEETETQFRQFYQYRDDIMQGDDNKIEQWLQLARSMMEKGIEVADIVGMELRQMSRILGKDLSL